MSILSSLPPPQPYHNQSRILANSEVVTGDQQPGIRASKNKADWKWRSIEYKAADGETYYLNRNSAVKYLERHGELQWYNWASKEEILTKISKIAEKMEAAQAKAKPNNVGADTLPINALPGVSKGPKPASASASAAVNDIARGNMQAPANTRASPKNIPADTLPISALPNVVRGPQPAPKRIQAAVPKKQVSSDAGAPPKVKKGKIGDPAIPLLQRQEINPNIALDINTDWSLFLKGMKVFNKAMQKGGYDPKILRAMKDVLEKFGNDLNGKLKALGSREGQVGHRKSPEMVLLSAQRHVFVSLRAKFHAKHGFLANPQHETPGPIMVPKPKPASASSSAAVNAMANANIQARTNNRASIPTDTLPISALPHVAPGLQPAPTHPNEAAATQKKVSSNAGVPPKIKQEKIADPNIPLLKRPEVDAQIALDINKDWRAFLEGLKELNAKLIEVGYDPKRVRALKDKLVQLTEGLNGKLMRLGRKVGNAGRQDSPEMILLHEQRQILNSLKDKFYEKHGVLPNPQYEKP